ILPDTKTFSIIYTVFDKYTLQKVFYYKENQLIACIIEETDANNANKLLHYADYFYKNGVLINAGDENKEFPATEAYLEGMEKLKEFNTLNNYKFVISTSSTQHLISNNIKKNLQIH